MTLPPSSASCQKAATSATGLLGAFVPRCSPSGRLYRPMQCHKNWCFCVDPIGGLEAPGTRIRAFEARLAPCGGKQCVHVDDLTGREVMACFAECHMAAYEQLERDADSVAPDCLPNGAQNEYIHSILKSVHGSVAGTYNTQAYQKCQPIIGGKYKKCVCLDAMKRPLPGTETVLSQKDRTWSCPLPAFAMDGTAQQIVQQRDTRTGAVGRDSVAKSRVNNGRGPCFSALEAYKRKGDSSKDDMPPSCTKGGTMTITDLPCFQICYTRGFCLSGFFELVQCSSTECYCADAVSGAEVKSTRVSRRQGAPLCPACNRVKYFLYRNGRPTPGTRVPQCNNDGRCHILVADSC